MESARPDCRSIGKYLFFNIVYLIMKLILNQSVTTPPQREMYRTPESTCFKVAVRRSICITSPNSTPDMEWGNEYDQEPED